MPATRGKAFKERVISEIERLLCTGSSLSVAERKILSPQLDEQGVDQNPFRGLGRSTFYRYVAELRRRWAEQSRDSAPHRREQLFRTVELHYLRAMEGERVPTGDGRSSRVSVPWGPATQTLRLLAEMTGVLVPRDPEHDARVAAVGPPPRDPTAVLVWAQRCLALQLDDLMRSNSVDPEKKTRLIADIVAKLGMTHAKALVEAKFEVLEGKVGDGGKDAGQLAGYDGPLPATARLGGAGAGRPRPSRRRRGAAEGEDGGGAAGGGRGLGPSS